MRRIARCALIATIASSGVGGWDELLSEEQIESPVTWLLTG